MKPATITSAARSWNTYAIATGVRPNVFGNHIGMPETRKMIELATIAQKYAVRL